MLILALDTTTRAGSCALARDGRVLREEASEPSRPPAARLPEELVGLLERERVALQDVDVYAVATGPGSFTGLRVGIATMQGLAVATEKPLIGISALDALAMIGSSVRRAAAAQPPPRKATAARRSALREGGRTRRDAERIATWVDAWRGEVYAAVYGNGREMDPPVVAHPDRLLPRLAGHLTLFIGDGAAAYQDRICATLGDEARFANPMTPLLAGAIARLATDAARAGHRSPPHAIRPLYVRRPDAELARDAR